MASQRRRKELRIVQWNCQSIKKKTPEIQFRAANFDVILLSETWLKPEDTVYLNGFDVVRKDREKHTGGGVLIFVNNRLKYKRITNIYNCDDKLELCAIELFLAEESILLASCYRPPDQGIDLDQWDRFFSQFTGKFLITGDFNPHHLLWGDKKDCETGSKIVECVLDSEISILNGESMTFKSRQYQTESAIDLAFVNNRSLHSYSWKVNDEPWGSDHFPIFITLNQTVVTRIPYTQTMKLYTRKTDWEKFKNNLMDNYNTAVTLIRDDIIDTQAKYVSFISLIIDVLADCSPGLQGSRKSSNDNVNTNPPIAPSWSAECDKLIRIRKGALKRLREFYSHDNFIKYKQIEATTKSRLRKIKQEQWQELAAKFTKYTNLSYIFKIIKRFDNRLNYTENRFEYKEEVINSARSTFDSICPPWVECEMPTFDDNDGDPFLVMPFSREEFDVVVSGLRVGSAPVIDGIDYRIIVALPKEFQYLLLELFNEIYLKGAFSNEWRQYAVFFIPKGDGVKVRPIALAPCLLKILERLINNRLCWWLEYHNILPDSDWVPKS